MNVRIDARTAALLKRVARERGLSDSEVLGSHLGIFASELSDVQACRRLSRWLI
jgi:hypothetical protein